ncbi:MAG: ribokinase [Actinobacteria bacterium HGW-Actinobacteria-6]|jgi:ribokinase|nr:MAG: ribokinase [Actinobacteria bacterium HGW-Actinobacteria-6]
MSEVVVIGSINVDRSVSVPGAPLRGATLLGGGVRRGPGGKGANQAVALARLGRSVAMIGAVGNDADGDWMLSILAEEGIDVSGVVRVPDPTGQAFIFVESDGESTIVVSPGANSALTPELLDNSRDAIASARCVLVQQEIPSATVERAAELAEGIFVLNPAPARPVSEELLARVDVLVPNRFELAGLTGGLVPQSTDDVARMALAFGGSQAVVVTLGSDGAVVAEAGVASEVPATRVEAVDATAAGDTFCGALVDALLDGMSLVGASAWASRAAAFAVSRHGAQESIPYRADVVDN